ncbi:RimK family alpha-L-glutamate ligase [Aestuariibacter sp. A3R04]|uniref:ATP-grasp domain-containing protein n=1 Tax=Aestuariibacter sp. A3R04 TaxID=2841571 RepID=UPI001C09524D|nr:hypothetical protein [Aestuariibacter sp. A3R04]MBU3023483.1 hypothetical protein [Aestuariibacter sp. A3R04]
MLTLCLGDGNDPQIRHLIMMLNDMHHDALVLNTSAQPPLLSVSHWPGTLALSLVLDDIRLDLEQIGAFYWQRFFPPPSVDSASLKNQISALSGFFHYAPHRWYNTLDAIRFHQAKPVQLQEVQQLGVTIPNTLISNCPRDITPFFQEVKKVAVKPVFGGCHTQLVTSLNELPCFNEKNTLPLTYQHYIEGDDVRTFVIDEDAFSGIIYSEVADYRTDTTAIAERIPTPEIIKQQSMAICQQLGMKWCAIDWRRTQNGEFVFLEANPCPQFLKFEHDTQHPISEALCTALTSVASS